jgi:hypothetical protein
MQLTKSRVLSAITAGSLTLAVVAAITVGSGSGSGPGHTAQPAALAAQTESFPPVNIDDCPILHTGYPTGGCVAQLQTDLNIIQGRNLTVDGTFGPVHSQTYNAVIAFQQAYGLQQDGMVGPATKNALEAAIPGSSVPPSSVPPSSVPPSSVPPPQAPAAHYTWGYGTGTVYYNRQATRDMKTQAAAETAAAGICVFLGGETLGAACVISGAVMFQWQYVAGNAYGDGKCLKIKLPTFWASEYTNSYCK